MWSQLGITWPQVWLTIASAVGVYVTMVVLSRVFGQRQFVSSSTYDLAFTFAMGSLIGRTVLVRVSLATAVIALCTMFVLHMATGWLHHRFALVHRVIQNAPVLLVRDGRLLDDQLRRTGTSRDEVFQALRLQGRGALDDVAALILEPNGNFSIVDRSQRLDPEVFDDVAGAHT